MAAKTWLVAVEWTHDGVQDVDEVTVSARTKLEAFAAARRAWRAGVAVQWPGIRIKRVFAIELAKRGGV